jgi:nitroimidazol reductase NimA-like FMN-containing flavoprotein (pyridoxamine 5'-phosphate oxidase superfamily)
MPDSSANATFTPTDRSRVKRLHERGKYDEATIFPILDAAVLAHIAYVIDGQPFVTPTGFWRQGRTLYWHGSAASRMLRFQEAGVPACVAVTHLDGLVLARSGFHHSINYRSVMAFGTARLVNDPQEEAAQLDLFVDRLYPERRGEIRPNEKQELKGTTVIAMEIEEASAKIRTGPPKDDEPDYLLDVWAGVIPIMQVVGEAVADPLLKPGIAFPRGLSAYKPGARFDELLTANLAK